MTVPGVFPELKSCCAMRGPEPGENPDRFPELGVAVQENDVFVTLERFWMEQVWPEQMVWPGGLKKTSGRIETFTVKSVTFPLQEAAEGVI